MSMTKEEMNAAIQKFINDGGEVTQLMYADEKSVKKAQRASYHLDRQHGSEKSRKAVERARAREEGMIFSRDERWKK